MRKERITRHKAEEWLGATVHKRRLRKPHVARYAQDMRDGRWNVDVAPPILIEVTTGAVLNGNHRLTAFLETNLESFESYVHYGTDEDAVRIDLNPPRNLIDTLDMRGHEHSKYKSAWLNRGIQWMDGTKSNSILRRDEQVEIIEKSPGVEAAVLIAKHHSEMGKKVVRVPIGTTAVLFDISEYGYGGDVASDFVERLQTSQDLTRTMGRLQGRMQEAVNSKSKFALSPDALSYLIARVFVATINDEDLSKMYARRNSVTDIPGFQDWATATFGKRFR